MLISTLIGLVICMKISRVTDCYCAGDGFGIEVQTHSTLVNSDKTTRDRQEPLDTLDLYRLAHQFRFIRAFGHVKFKLPSLRLHPAKAVFTGPASVTASGQLSAVKFITQRIQSAADMVAPA